MLHCGKKIRELLWNFCSIVCGIRTLLVVIYECFLDHNKENSYTATSRVLNLHNNEQKICNSLMFFPAVYLKVISISTRRKRYWWHKINFLYNSCSFWFIQMTLTSNLFLFWHISCPQPWCFTSPLILLESF